MAFTLAPYNNAMRLGQGFNTYTQQICIDDAVVIDPERPENVLTNDGSTMRILVQSMGRPSAWSRQKEILTSEYPEVDTERVPAKLDTGRKPGNDGPTTTQRQIEKPFAKPSEENDKQVKQGSVSKIEKSVKSPESDEKELGEETAQVEVPVKEEDDEYEEVSAKSPTPDAKIEKEADDEGDKSNQTIPAGAKQEESNDMLSGDVDWSNYTNRPRAAADDKEKQELMEAEKEREREERALRKEREQERMQVERERREDEKSRREEARKNRDEAAGIKAYTKEELQQKKVEFEPRFNGMMENKKDFDFDATVVSGPSQMVTYTSRFIDKLSDVTDDMNISGSLSIKAGKFGGSGRGAFIDSDKFKESDLNFYISVKVVNQTINFKDALQFNPIRSVNSDNFREVFGDGFISGFQEGGEFNALVSMKILNKAKVTDIKAEAKVAFTAGPVDLTAEANVQVAKSNIETNTETTIQVSWSGGGHIKPREQQWDIQSLMQAASRFPDLVAQCPQRTYAIITKYDALRSFVKLKPAAYTKLQYENAQMYTNAMMDAYMSYKSLFTKVGSYVFDVQKKLKMIKPWEDNTNALTSTSDQATESVSVSGSGVVKDYSKDITQFAASIKGLEDVKKAIRRQMAVIVNEVDNIENDPKLATDEDHPEPFQSPAAFEERIPKVEAIEKPKTAAPLGGKRIMAKTQTEGELALEDAAAEQTGPLLSETAGFSMEEKTALESIEAQRVSLNKNLRLTAPIGSETQGKPFNNLDFLQPEWTITKIMVGISGGCVASLWLIYDNGLVVSRGKATEVRWVELMNFREGERITAAAISTGIADAVPAERRVLSLQLFTNRGRSLIGQAEKCAAIDSKKQTRDNVTFGEIQTCYFDAPLTNATVKGFSGRNDDTNIWRLGLIWGDLPEVKPVTEVNAQDYFTQAAVAQSGELQAAVKAKDEMYNSTIMAKEAEWTNKSDQLRRELDRVQASLQTSLSGGATSSFFKRGRIQIHFIMYGGSLIWDDEVAQRILNYAERGDEFELVDSLFLRDPWEGNYKSGAVIYRYDETGPMRCLIAKQESMMRFDPLP